MRALWTTFRTIQVVYFYSGAWWNFCPALTLRSKELSDRPLPQANAYAMIQRRTKAAGIDTRVCCHTFRATGITAYLKNEGTLEKAAQMANHASTRTTQLYDRRSDEVSLDEIERIVI